MMRLLYDLYYAQPLNGSKFHGGGEYMKTVFKYLVEKRGENTIEVFFNPDAFLDDWIYDLIKENEIATHFIHNIKEVESILGNGFDTFYTGMPYQYIDISLPQTVRKIATIHGLRNSEKPVDKYTYLYFTGKRKYIELLKSFNPDYFSNKATAVYSNCAKKFDEIITDSVHSKYAISNFLKLDNIDIKTFYAPNKICADSEISDEQKNQIIKYGKYVLLLGGNRWEKNLYRAILALESLFKAGQLDGYKVVICGRVPNKIKKSISDLNKYIFNDFVETDYLEKLYLNCDFFIYPTLNEGFGMPPLEAMKYGKTCIVSAVCSLPEICGDAVIYTNPYDIKEIANRILQVRDSKLNPEIVQAQFQKIDKKQKLDMDKMIEFIYNR